MQLFWYELCQGMPIVMLKRLKSSSVSDVHYASDKKNFRELIVPMRGGPDIRLAITCHI